MCDREGCLCKTCARHIIDGNPCGACCDTCLWITTCSTGGITECGNYIDPNSFGRRISNFLSKIFKGGKKNGSKTN